MRTNMQKLKGKIVEKDTTIEAVAKAIGMDRTTFFRKMKNQGLSFSIGEVHKMVDAIPLTFDEAKDIFLAE